MEKDQSGEDKMARGRNGKGRNGKIPKSRRQGAPIGRVNRGVRNTGYVLKGECANIMSYAKYYVSVLVI